MIDDDSDVKKVYTIKEAAKLVGIESHVLRYWEEELEINIERNELGHRYYSDEDVKLFCEVKRLKDNGIGLKAIRKMIKEIKLEQENGINEEKRASEEAAGTMVYAAKEEKEIKKTDNTVVDFKMAQLQALLNRAVLNSVKAALPEAIEKMVPEILTEGIKTVITENVVKQVDQLMREQDDREEERYKKLDEKLREITQDNLKNGNKKKRFFRK